MPFNHQRHPSTNLLAPAFIISALVFVGIAFLSTDLFRHVLGGVGDSQHTVMHQLGFAAAVVLTVLAVLLYSTMRHQRNALFNESNTLKQIIELEPECVKTVAADGTLVSMNPAGLDFCEADSFEQLNGACVFDLVVPEDRERFMDFHRRVIGGSSEQLEFDIMGLKGTRRTMRTFAVPLPQNDPVETTLHLAITHDITATKKIENEMRYRASHDPLTALLNRNEFEKRLRECLHESPAHCTHAVLILDVDQFKLINDSAGHIAGDELLKSVGNTLKQNLRRHDTIARFGGDEFAVLLEDCSLQHVDQVAEKLRASLENSEFFWDGRRFKLTASIGATFIDQQLDLTGILIQADTACHIAKEKGRNRVAIFEHDDEEILRKQGEISWVSKIHEGLAESRFILYAQHIVSLDPARGATGAELLVRYRDADGSILPPGGFIAAAERFGLMPKIDCYVIDRAIDFMEANPRVLNDIAMFYINISGASITNRNVLDCIERRVAANPDIAAHLCLELTETATISDLAAARQFIDSVKAMGIKLALDDFGTGVSSLSYLKNLPVDIVKIDGEFVKDLVDDPLDLAMVKAINEIAQLLGKTTIAEFVENDNIRQQLLEIGVDYAQGFGIDLPRPIEALVIADDDLYSQAS